MPRLIAVEPWHGAGRQHDEVRLRGAQVVEVDLRAEPDIDVGLGELALVVRDQLGDLGPHRRMPGEAQLTAELVRRFVEHDLVAGERADPGGLQPGRSAADDDDPRGSLHAAHVVIAEDQLAAGADVDDARGAGAQVQPADAALVAPDARLDVVVSARQRLGDQLRFGDRGPHHRDEVRRPVSDDRGRLGERHDPAGDDRRQRGHPGDLTRHGELIAVRFMGRTHQQIAPVVTAVGQVDVVDQARFFEEADELDQIVDRGLIVGAVGRQAHPDGHGRSDRVAYRGQRLEQEPGPILERTAVLVGAPVGGRRQERAEQVAVTAVHLQAVDASGHRPLRTRRTASEHLGDHPLRHRPADHRQAGIGDR